MATSRYEESASYMAAKAAGKITLAPAPDAQHGYAEVHSADCPCAGCEQWRPTSAAEGRAR